jgi:hypothetical protein
VTIEGASRSMPVSAWPRLPMRSACWNRAHGRLGLRRVQRLAHLPEDLALAQDHRVHARGHAEQVGDGGLVEVDVDVAHELVAVEARLLGQQPRDLLDGTVEALGLDVDLDPVAGGDDDGLGDEGRLEHEVRELDRRVDVERGVLEDVDRG